MMTSRATIQVKSHFLSFFFAFLFDGCLRSSCFDTILTDKYILHISDVTKAFVFFCTHINLFLYTNREEKRLTAVLVILRSNDIAYCNSTTYSDKNNHQLFCQNFLRLLVFLVLVICLSIPMRSRC